MIWSLVVVCVKPSGPQLASELGRAALADHRGVTGVSEGA